LVTPALADQLPVCCSRCCHCYCSYCCCCLPLLLLLLLMLDAARIDRWAKLTQPAQGAQFGVPAACARAHALLLLLLLLHTFNCRYRCCCCCCCCCCLCYAMPGLLRLV